MLIAIICFPSWDQKYKEMRPTHAFGKELGWGAGYWSAWWRSHGEPWSPSKQMKGWGEMWWPSDGQVMTTDDSDDQQGSLQMNLNWYSHFERLFGTSYKAKCALTTYTQAVMLE